MDSDSEAAARQLKNKYGDEWRSVGAHMVAVKRGPKGHFVWVGVDPAQPLPASRNIDGIDVVFEHAPRVTPASR